MAFFTYLELAHFLNLCLQRPPIERTKCKTFLANLRGSAEFRAGKRTEIAFMQLENQLEPPNARARPSVHL
jgi:hypothetical protein